VPERPRQTGIGIIREERTPDHIYEIEMPNGFRAVAVLPKEGPACPDDVEPVGAAVVASFSPFDMSRCRIVEWKTGPG